jgi:DNA-binding XRE family transcriptional regulator
MSSTARVALSSYATDLDDPHQLVAWSRLPPPSLMLMIGETERRDRFGYALYRAIKRRGLSERQLAQMIQVDARRIAKWRTGKALPNIYETQALAAALRVDEDLFRNPPERPDEPDYPIDRYLLETARKAAG